MGDYIFLRCSEVPQMLLKKHITACELHFETRLCCLCSGEVLLCSIVNVIRDNSKKKNNALVLVRGLCGYGALVMQINDGDFPDRKYGKKWSAVG